MVSCGLQDVVMHWTRIRKCSRRDYFESYIGPSLPTCEALGVPMMLGRLGQVVEGGGKRRILAIGNYINQRLLNPVHSWLMSILARLPMDGTFAQERPLDRLVGEKVCYCFDFQSATDAFSTFSLTLRSGIIPF